MTRHTFSLNPRGPFSMAPIRDLQCGFLRGSRTCSTDPGSVHLAFPQDGDFTLVGAYVRQQGSSLQVEVSGATDMKVVRTQLERTLCLDHDSATFHDVLRQDPALRPIAAQHPGFRPVVAYSPYVMGGWAILSQRLRMAQAAALQVRVAEACGDVVEVAGETLPSFPPPRSLLGRAGFAGIPDEKWRRLQILAEAALRGELEVARLAAMPYADARAKLMELRGVGPWTADAILLRGVGPADALPLSEPSLHNAVAETYGLSRMPDDAEVEAIAEAWRPFRMWTSVLLVSHYRSGSPRPTRSHLPRRTDSVRVNSRAVAAEPLSRHYR